MVNLEFVNLLLIFFPGIVGVMLINFLLRNYKTLGTNEWIIYSFVLGIFSYLPLAICYNQGDIFTLNITATIIFKALAISIFISILIILFINKEILHFIFRKLKISNTMGKKYIIKNIFSTKDEKFKFLRESFVHIRYQNRDLSYSGTITAIDIHDNGYVEILLSNAGATYNNKENFSYIMKYVLIFEKVENIIIEFPEKN